MTLFAGNKPFYFNLLGKGLTQEIRRDRGSGFSGNPASSSSIIGFFQATKEVIPATSVTSKMVGKRLGSWSGASPYKTFQYPRGFTPSPAKNQGRFLLNLPPAFMDFDFMVHLVLVCRLCSQGKAPWERGWTG